MKSALLQVLFILAVGSGVGAVSNAVRGNGQIKLTKNYFRVLKSAPENAPDAVTDAAPIEAQAPVDASAAEEAATTPALEHGFTSVSLDEAVDYYLSPGYASGEVVFVDARDSEYFSEAHIPGAIHIDRYNSDQDFDAAEMALSLADVIVVYCGGGECEDSIYLATELVEERSIPLEKVHVFEGGMQAWEGDNLDVEGSEAE